MIYHARRGQISRGEAIGILLLDTSVPFITADGRSLDEALLTELGLADADRLVIQGLEDRPNFYRFAIEEIGSLDPRTVESEVVAAGRALMARDDAVKVLLLECSLLPPYAAALQKAVQVPVFDYITMINHVFSAVVKQPYAGFM
jgi:hypothetical protein